MLYIMGLVILFTTLKLKNFTFKTKINKMKKQLTIFIIAVLLLLFPTMWLWNWLMPVIFKLPLIDVWQTLGLNLLTSNHLKKD